MEIYLPIAELSINAFVLLGLGAAAGLLSGMFGVGGGFLATPLLIFVGIPPAVAVASQANQVVANSISSRQVQWRRGNVDLRMGLVLLAGELHLLGNHPRLHRLILLAQHMGEYERLLSGY